MQVEMKFANRLGYSDVEPFEVVRVVSDKCLEIRGMEAELDPSWKPNIGDRVLNRHRQSCDYPQHVRDAYRGTVIEVITGCNPLVRVQFDGSEFPSLLPPQDLAPINN